MYLPQEILIQIAWLLNAKDLAAFRLVNRQHCEAGFSALAKNGISLLDTVTDMLELTSIVRTTRLSRHVRQLKLFHGDWPLCSRDEWETHPLLFGGNDRSHLSKIDLILSREAHHAFRRYERFMQREMSRRFEDDIFALNQVLNDLPLLSSFAINHIQSCVWRNTTLNRYDRLQRSIWLAPNLTSDVSAAVETFLLALPNDHTLSKFTIGGLFNPSLIGLNYGILVFDKIRHLEIANLRVNNDETAMVDFLSAFPNLSTLSLQILGYGPTTRFLGRVSWKSLKMLDVGGFWSSEADLSHFLSAHAGTLNILTLTDIALIEGSWRSFFTRTRALLQEQKECIQINIEGELYGRNCRETLSPMQHKQAKLDAFLANSGTVWPF